MLLAIKNELSRGGMVIKVRRVKEVRSAGNAQQGMGKTCYRCLLARPGRVLHTSITVPNGVCVTVADVFQLLEADGRGRQFLNGFQNSEMQQSDLPIDEHTSMDELREACRIMNGES